VIATAVLLLLAACAVNPVTGRHELILVSQAEEARLGRAGAEQVAAEMGIFADAPLTEYVAAVGGRVAARSPRAGVAWRFEIVDQEAPNAFALPDGHIYVSRGLLELANSEDELAGVLAHEVVHVAARHHAQQRTRATGVGILALPAIVAGSLLGGPVGQVVEAPVLLLGSGLVASYGRDQEREADRFGQRLAAEAGYDPSALAAFLATLERWSDAREGGSHEAGFFDTHPSTPERVANARSNAALVGLQRAAGIAPDPQAFLGRLAGLLVGPNPAEGVVAGQRFLHPDLDFTLSFPDGWRVVNARSTVGAASPDGRAIVTLQIQSQGDDPSAAAGAMIAALSRETAVDLRRSGARDIGGRRAVRAELVARGARGPMALQLTWIAHGGAIFLVAGVADADSAQASGSAFDATSGSFRPLDAEERGSILELRLRLVRARPGESLDDAVRRGGSAWGTRQVAIANARDPNEPLAGDELLKIAVRRPYAGAR
jgi:predicted Zn-dependent protease